MIRNNSTIFTIIINIIFIINKTIIIFFKSINLNLLSNEIFSLKKEADDELHKQNYDIAINKYKDSILKIKELGTNKDDITEEEKTSFTNEIMIPANLNISYIYLKSEIIFFIIFIMMFNSFTSSRFIFSLVIFIINIHFIF